jgi:DNA-binding NtrC family response regulator
MRANNLDLKELLELNPDGGMVHFSGQRALIYDAVTQGLLRKELIDTYGERTARGILSRSAYIHGRRLAEVMKTKFDWDSEEEWQKAGARIYSLLGLFMLDPESKPTFSPQGGTFKVSYEAEQHLLLNGRSDYPVCWNLCGLISGYQSFALGKEMYALEDKCIGKGDSACHVTIKSKEEWGDKVAGELGVFTRMGIDEALRDVSSKLKRVESRLRDKERRLAVIEEIEEEQSDPMARSPEMRKLMELVKTIAAIPSTVHITGESGTGKERMARFVHDHSPRVAGPFIAINCGAITETLLESELFGHARGAFTDAAVDRAGLFEAANGGTLFLDEVGEISLPMQVKLLRVLQEREVRRVGENKSRPINVRILSATNKNLMAEVAEKRFREDLYYRLNVVELFVPPLRKRREDILPLARILLAEAANKMKRGVDGLTSTAADKLLGYAWPGNVRELANAMERAVAVAKTNRIDVGDLPEEVRKITPNISDIGAHAFLKDVERDYILSTLEKTKGNRQKTAALLGIGSSTLLRKLRIYKLGKQVKNKKLF